MSVTHRLCLALLIGGLPLQGCATSIGLKEPPTMGECSRVGDYPMSNLFTHFEICLARNAAASADPDGTFVEWPLFTFLLFHSCPSLDPSLRSELLERIRRAGENHGQPDLLFLRALDLSRNKGPLSQEAREAIALALTAGSSEALYSEFRRLHDFRTEPSDHEIGLLWQAFEKGHLEATLEVTRAALAVVLDQQKFEESKPPLSGGRPQYYRSLGERLFAGSSDPKAISVIAGVTTSAVKEFLHVSLVDLSYQLWIVSPGSVDVADVAALTGMAAYLYGASDDRSHSEYSQKFASVLAGDREGAEAVCRRVRKLTQGFRAGAGFLRHTKGPSLIQDCLPESVIVTQQSCLGPDSIDRARAHYEF